MTRPCFLVVDREYPGSISTRKLVIETAKLNVLTAYSGAEAVAMFRRFPAVNGMVVDSGIEDMSCGELVRTVKEAAPKLPVIVIATPGFAGCEEADFQLEAFEPTKLLGILNGLLPEETEAIHTREEELSLEEAE